MSLKLFTHRRLRESPRPLRGRSGSLTCAARTDDGLGSRTSPGAASPPAQGKRIRTRFVVSSENGGRKPKTIITISSSYRQSQGKQHSSPEAKSPAVVSSSRATSSPTASSPVAPGRARSGLATSGRSISGRSTSQVRQLTPPADVKHRKLTDSPTLVTPDVSVLELTTPQTTPVANRNINRNNNRNPVVLSPFSMSSSDTHSTIYEDAMESFGIDTLSSPTSTLHERRSIYDVEPRLVWTSTSEDDTVQSIKTVIDDGLSAWGLPKVMEPPGDDDDDDIVIDESDAVMADMDYISGSYKHPLSVKPGMVHRAASVNVSENSSENEKKLKLRAQVAYVAKLVLEHRRNQQAKQHANQSQKRLPKPAVIPKLRKTQEQTQTARSFSSLKGVASSIFGLGAWM